MCRFVDDISWVKRTVNRRLAKGHGFYLQHAKETCLVGRKYSPLSFLAPLCCACGVRAAAVLAAVLLLLLLLCAYLALCCLLFVNAQVRHGATRPALAATSFEQRRGQAKAQEFYDLIEQRS